LEVEKLLNFFTFLPQPTIAETMRQHSQAPERRVAQHLLAREFVELVHGPEDAQAAQEKHLNRSNASTASSATTADVQLPAEQVLGQPLSSLLFTAGLAESKTKAVKLIESGGAYLIDASGNAMKIQKGAIVTEESLISNEAGKHLTLRAGKWKSRTIGLA
jgi:tyrosyl-tRNA synthetase